MTDESDSSSREKKKEGTKSQTIKEFSISHDGTHVDNLKEFIKNTIKDKISGSTKSYSSYTKPYTAKVESLKIPIGYQSSKFQ